MTNFIITLFICSAGMSAIIFLYMAGLPFLSKYYSEKRLYYTWLIIVIGLIIPFRPHFDNALITREVPVFSAESSTGTAHFVTPSYFASHESDYLSAEQSAAANREILPRFAAIPGAESATNAFARLPHVRDIWQIVFAVWLVGAVIFLAHHIIRHLRFMNVVNRWSEKITDAQILSMYEKIRAEMGITRKIPLYACPFGSPMVIGIIKPRIFLPAENFGDIHFILRHELVHYRRKDLLYKYLLIAATAMHWFNPLVYLAAEKIHALCEISCDAEVLQCADKNTRQSYIETLLGIVKYQSGLKTALSTNFGKDGVKNRISSVMDTRRKKAGQVIAGITVFLTIGTGFIFAATPSVECSAEYEELRSVGSLETAVFREGLTIICDSPLYVIRRETGNLLMADITLAFADSQNGTAAQPPRIPNVPFEDAVKIAANEINREFNFCINEMVGYMGFLDVYTPIWSGAVISQELTAHSDGDELFTFVVDAVTGIVLSVMMNTEESPFLG
ncbi:MAG: M56 family metallopeptidase [Defluviitaleaceae bacterium]|nr:M56 family metallopeptidase [Defluviitaleaceae bacterium]